MDRDSKAYNLQEGSFRASRKNFVSVYDLIRQRRIKSSQALRRRVERILEDKTTSCDFEEIHCGLPDHVESTFLMTFSPDGRKVASAHGDHRIYISDLNTGKLIDALEGHQKTPCSLCWHPSNNDLLASGCLNGEVRVWDLMTKECQIWCTTKSGDHNHIMFSLDFHPVDRLLLIATLNEVHLWDWSEPKPFETLTTSDEKEKVRFVKFDSSGTRLITGIANLSNARSCTVDSLQNRIIDSYLSQTFDNPSAPVAAPTIGLDDNQSAADVQQISTHSSRIDTQRNSTQIEVQVHVENIHESSATSDGISSQQLPHAMSVGIGGVSSSIVGQQREENSISNNNLISGISTSDTAAVEPIAVTAISSTIASGGRSSSTNNDNKYDAMNGNQTAQKPTSSGSSGSISDKKPSTADGTSSKRVNNDCDMLGRNIKKVKYVQQEDDKKDKDEANIGPVTSHSLLKQEPRQEHQRLADPHSTNLLSSLPTTSSASEVVRGSSSSDTQHRSTTGGPMTCSMCHANVRNQPNMNAEIQPRTQNHQHQPLTQLDMHQLIHHRLIDVTSATAIITTLAAHRFPIAFESVAAGLAATLPSALHIHYLPIESSFDEDRSQLVGAGGSAHSALGVEPVGAASVAAAAAAAAAVDLVPPHDPLQRYATYASEPIAMHNNTGSGIPSPPVPFPSRETPPQPPLGDASAPPSSFGRVVHFYTSQVPAHAAFFRLQNSTATSRDNQDRMRLSAEAADELDVSDTLLGTNYERNEERRRAQESGLRFPPLIAAGRRVRNQPPPPLRRHFHVNGPYNGLSRQYYVWHSKTTPTVVWDHRVQCWSFSRSALPNLKNAEANVVAPKCRINHAGSLDVSADGRLLACLVPRDDVMTCPQTYNLRVYSLRSSNFGACLYEWPHGWNAVSVSLSPLGNYLVVGLTQEYASYRFLAQRPSDTRLVAKVLKLSYDDDCSSSTGTSNDLSKNEPIQPRALELVRNIKMLKRERMTVNAIRWLPAVASPGLIYSTTAGQLVVARPSCRPQTLKPSHQSLDDTSML